MLFSRYVFSYDMGDGVIALYHSLFVVTVFLNKEEIEVIKNSSFSDSKLKENYRFLYENCFVVSEPSDDDSIYNTFCSLIPKNHVSNVYIITTLNCNYNCSYCFISQSREREQKKSCRKISQIKQYHS